MEAVWKYELKYLDFQTIEMPAGSVPLTAAMQGNHLCIWEKVNPDHPQVDVNIRVAGTGHPLVIDDTWFYVGTAFDKSGLVWHVFQQIQELVTITLENTQEYGAFTHEDYRRLSGPNANA